MCDNKHGPSFHQLIHAFVDQFFGSCIDRGCRLIKNQNRRIGYCCPCDRQKLPLSLGKICPICRHHGIVTIWKSSDKRVCICNACRPLDLFLRCIQFSKADVIRYGSGKQMRILKHDAKRVSQCIFLIFRTSIPS